MNTVVYDLETQYNEGINAAAKAIADGDLAIFPTETVYGIGGDAANPKAVAKIFEAKGRPQDNPLIVHISDRAQVYRITKDVSETAECLMNAFWPGPFTIILKSNGALPKTVSAGLDTIAVRYPSSPIAQELIRASGCLIAAPSANRSGTPSGTKAEHVTADFMGIVPVILDGGRSQVGLESTVCDATGAVPVLLRPGGVTLEMLQDAVGSMEVSGAVLHALGEGESPRSPGMKYRHYAPNAKVLIVTGSKCAIYKGICAMYDKGVDEGRVCAIVCASDRVPKYGSRKCLPLGMTVEEEARNLFDVLRTLDTQGVEQVYFEAMDEAGIGLAVMNRALRAAGFEMIDADEEEQVVAYLTGLHR